MALLAAETIADRERMKYHHIHGTFHVTPLKEKSNLDLLILHIHRAPLLPQGWKVTGGKEVEEIAIHAKNWWVRS